MKIPKLEVNINNWSPALDIFNYVSKASDTEILISEPVCDNIECGRNKTSYRRYFEPTALMITQSVFHSLIRDPNAEGYGLDRFHRTFMDLPMAITELPIINNDNKDWIQVL